MIPLLIKKKNNFIPKRNEITKDSYIIFSDDFSQALSIHIPKNAYDLNTNYIVLSENTILDNLFKELLKEDYNKLPKEAVLHLNNVFKRFVAFEDMIEKNNDNNFYLKNYVMNNESSGELIKKYKLKDFKFFTTNKSNLNRIRGSII